MTDISIQTQLSVSVQHTQFRDSKTQDLKTTYCTQSSPKLIIRHPITSCSLVSTVSLQQHLPLCSHVASCLRVNGIAPHQHTVCILCCFQVVPKMLSFQISISISIYSRQDSRVQPQDAVARLSEG